MKFNNIIDNVRNKYKDNINDDTSKVCEDIARGKPIIYMNGAGERVYDVISGNTKKTKDFC